MAHNSISSLLAKVAIKQLPSEQSAVERTEDFRREIRKLAQSTAHCEHICHVLGCCIKDSQLCLVVEDGTTSLGQKLDLLHSAGAAFTDTVTHTPCPPSPRYPAVRARIQTGCVQSHLQFSQKAAVQAFACSFPKKRARISAGTPFDIGFCHSSFPFATVSAITMPI